MKKFWSILKKIVLVWGFLCLAFVLFIVIMLTLESLDHHHASPQPAEEEVFTKTVDDLQLRIVRRNETGTFVVSVSRQKTPLVADYVLPTERFDLDWVDITDATVLPGQDGSYRIVLYSSSYECDEASADYIWLLKAQGKMELVEMLNLSDLHRLDGDEIVLFGNRFITLPSTPDLPYATLTVPVTVKIGTTISRAPLLTPQGSDLLRRYLEKTRPQRVSGDAAPPDEEGPEQFEKAAKALEESLSATTIPY